MKFAIIENGVVVNIAKSDSALDDNWIQSDSAKIGDLYDGDSFTPKPKELSEAKREKKVKMNSEYSNAIHADIDHNSITWKGDPEAQRLMAAVLAPGDDGELMHWRNATGSKHEMLSYADIRAIALKIRKRGFECDAKLQDKLALIENASTVSEVESITWEG